MAELKHSIAVFYDEEDRRQTICADDLVKQDVLRLAQRQVLYDESEQVRVHVRPSSTGTQHFYAPESGEARVFQGETSDPVHNTRVKQILRELKRLGRWDLLLKKKAQGKAVFSVIETLPPYVWDKEVHRIFAPKTIVRHDLFGHSPAVAMSVRRPWVAVETIHTHFPDEPAFAAMLELSSRTPARFFFDLVSHPTHLWVDGKKGNFVFSNWTFHIFDGKVWQGDIVRDIATSLDLQAAVKQMDDDFASWRSRR
jgi:hypothetical protein